MFGHESHTVVIARFQSASRSSPSFYNEKNQMPDTPEEQMSPAESMVGIFMFLCYFHHCMFKPYLMIFSIKLSSSEVQSRFP